MTVLIVIARSAATRQSKSRKLGLDCFAPLAMTADKETP